MPLKVESPPATTSASEPAEAIAAEAVAEARRRLREHDEGRVTPVPWAKARERIFRREP